MRQEIHEGGDSGFFFFPSVLCDLFPSRCCIARTPLGGRSLITVFEQSSAFFCISSQPFTHWQVSSSILLILLLLLLLHTASLCTGHRIIMASSFARILSSRRSVGLLSLVGAGSLSVGFYLSREHVSAGAQVRRRYPAR